MTRALTPFVVEAKGRVFEVNVRRHPRATRVSLRIDPGSGELVLTLPVGAHSGAARAFLDQQRGWIADQARRLPRRIRFKPGATVPLFGEPHEICHVPDARRGVWHEGDAIFVSGPAAHCERRVLDWLRAEARRNLRGYAERHATALGRRITRFSIRDTKSRWGSCSSTGALSFSWRLILAPDTVRNYVTAHEAAHLVELNHGARFWRLVERRAADWREQRDWLHEFGGQLLSYGPPIR